jgi:hypothetical protein
VVAVRLSDYVSSRVDLLKLDVEGSEGDVLLDSHRTAKLAMIDRVLVEYHQHLGGDALTLAQTLSLLEDADFDYLERPQTSTDRSRHRTSRTYSSTRPGRTSESRHASTQTRGRHLADDSDDTVRLPQHIDPYAFVGRLRAASLPTPRATFTSVYSADGAQTVLPLAEEAAHIGWDVRLWCLGRPPRDLRRWTVGSGEGTRGQNFNRLSVDVPSDQWLVQCDDDVLMRPCGLRNWLRLAARLGFDITQPGQAHGSHAAHPIVARRRRHLARATTIVEMGPLLGLAPRVRPHVPLLPEEGFGWTHDFALFDLGVAGFRLGIVDAVPMWHLRPPASNYDSEVEMQKCGAILHERGLRGYHDLEHVVATYHWV